MQKSFIPLILFLGSGLGINAQDSGPSVSPAAKTFNLQQDIVGMAANSVNLFTGDVALPINLVSLPGRNGLDVNVSIAYNNANTKNVVDIWNYEAPAGILGLGWAMDFPKIVADHKQTGTREDDEYYLVEGGSSSRLIRTLYDATAGYNVYETKNYQFWKIKFYSSPSTEKWEITKEDGTTFIYGDKNSGRSTIQYVVKWNNWIGNSSQVTNQSQLSYIWNLSEIVNPWGDKITYEYLNVDQFVGSTSGQKQTEASYLKQITDVIGRKVQFFYNEKGGSFYTEPHTEKATEPDAYQEVYEKNYLDHIDVLDENTNKFLAIHFGYGSINTGSTSKMLLTSIEQRNSASNALPKMRFEYILSGPTKGCLRSVTYPTGGSITYEYTEKTVGRSKRELKINAPAGFAEPRVWIEDDYVVVAWRQLNSNGTHSVGAKDVRLYVYQWVGEWKEQFLQTIGGVEYDTYVLPNIDEYYSYKKFQVVLQPKFFAVLQGNDASNNSVLYAYSKNEGIRGDWAQFTRNIDYGVGAPTLLSGNSFIVVGSFNDDSTHPSYRWVFDGNGWAESIINQTIGDHYYTSTNNYFISHNRAGVDGLPEINFNYLTEDRKWVTKQWSAPLNFASDNRSYWYASNSFVVAMAQNNPEFIYRWDQTYTNFYKDNILGTWDDLSYVFNISNSYIGILQRGAPAAATTARFDGVNWSKSANFSAYYQYRASFGDDYAIWTVDDRTTPVVGYLRNYNPNTLAWSDQNLTYTPNEQLFGNVNGANPVRTGLNFFAYSDKIYFRKTDGQWLPDYTLTVAPGSTISANSIRVGTKYFFYQDGSNRIQFIKNGIPSQNVVIAGTYFARGENNLYRSNTLVTHLGNWSTFNDNTSLQLHRIIDEQVTGFVKDYPVTLVTTTANGQAQYSCIDYDVAKSVMDPTGTVAMYNEVTVIPGSTSPLSKPNGYTKTYFHNGLSSTELFTTPFQTDLRWLGLPYETRVYNASNVLASYSINYYGTITKNFSNGDGVRVDVGAYVRPTSTVQMIDGIVTTTLKSYDSNTGLITQSNVSGPITAATHFKYFWEVYDPTRSKNILTPIAQTKQYVNDQVVESRALRFKSWTSVNNASGVFAPVDQFSWKGSGSPDFTVWDVNSNPSADWIFQSKVSARETLAGISIEEQSPGGISNSVVLNKFKNQIIAKASNTLVKDIAHESFEDFIPPDGTVVTVPTGARAKTGVKYWDIGPAGITVSGLTSSETYKVSFWAKTTNGSVTIDGVGTVSLGNLGSWTLFEYSITGRTSIGIRRSGATSVSIDEFRLHPIKATMVTATYHPIYGLQSSCDLNNQVLYNDYDEWGRDKNVVDDNGNILTTNSYNYKN